MKNTNQTQYEEAYFAGGCFWCVEAIYESIEGVHEAISGYAGGITANPTYEQVSAGDTEHAETVKVIYDPTVISFEMLVKAFFGSHDPTSLNRQGPDTGTQYRSIAFYSNEAEKKIIETIINDMITEAIYDKPIVTEVLPIGVFFVAEDYHQNYEVNNPYNPYIQAVSVPRLNRFKQHYSELLKDNHKEDEK